MPLVEEVFPERPVLIRDVAAQSLQLVMDYLGQPFPHSLSSDYAKPDAVRGAERVVFLCRQLRATAYYNAPGGTELYDRDAFMREGVELRFVVPRKVEYPQFRSPFVPWLSMLDVLMFNGREAVRTMLREYDLA